MLFTYDDHQAGTALQDGAGQPNRIRCVRDGRWKYAVYLDPAGRAAPEFEMYDLRRTPPRSTTSLTGQPAAPATAEHDAERRRLSRRLAELCADVGELAPALPA